MAPDVSLEECIRLARAMTLKNAAAGLAHGGGKSVIFADPAMPVARKEELIRAFAQAIRDIRDYIVGPDMGTDERCMAWVRDEIGRSVGLPAVVGGIPLDEIGATGLGLTVAAQVAEQFCDVRLRGARVAIQGFGAVGRHAARFLGERGAVLVAAADSSGTVHSQRGIDVERLIALKQAGGSVIDYPEAEHLPGDAIVDVDCDIWIPAARPDVIHKANVDRLRARLVIEGANIPITEDAERVLHDRGVLVIPDFIANAGGVICAAVEYGGGAQAVALRTVEEKVRSNAVAVLNDARVGGKPPREAAVALAEARVREAMSYRRHS
jgi:glutamate dehydrogenase (NAD(P)+)